jgi:hypothetical protein
LPVVAGRADADMSFLALYKHGSDDAVCHGDKLQLSTVIDELVPGKLGWFRSRWSHSALSTRTPPVFVTVGGCTWRVHVEGSCGACARGGCT